MAAEPDDILLVHLRRIDETVDRHYEDMRELKTRVTGFEEGPASVHRRMDGFAGHLDRIGKRLEPAEAQR